MSLNACKLQHPFPLLWINATEFNLKSPIQPASVRCRSEWVRERDAFLFIYRFHHHLVCCYVNNARTPSSFCSHKRGKGRKSERGKSWKQQANISFSGDTTHILPPQSFVNFVRSFFARAKNHNHNHVTHTFSIRIKATHQFYVTPHHTTTKYDNGTTIMKIFRLRKSSKHPQCCCFS